ncbi:MAG: DUF222 domain-containing protein [Pseudonocardiaceae bacterium]|nr:DUF222 domain-containing protein [Pseudonocardiaceae bacterium]
MATIFSSGGIGWARKLSGVGPTIGGMTALLAEPLQTDPVQLVSDGLQRLRESVPGLSDTEVQERVRAVESLSRQAHSVMLDLVAEMQARNLAGHTGFGSTARLLADMLSLSKAEARTRVGHAEQVGTRRALTGEALPARLPETAAALAAGEIGPAHLRIINEAMAAISDTATPADREWAEAHLTGWAPRLDPAALGRLAARVLVWLDPDGPEPATEEAPAPSGALRLRDRRNGGVGFEGWLGSEHGPALRELIERLAAPRPASEGIPDPRGVEERQADALVEVCGLARGAEHTPSSAGEPPHLTITLDLNTLIDGIGAAACDYGSYLSAGEIRRWACEAKVIPVVLGGRSELLDVGRAMRTVPLGIRRALVVRDRGCAFPGCGRPPSQCTAHHVIHWIDGGETSLQNCVLLCEHHHRVVHHTGWGIRIHADHAEFVPPTVIDPQRTPLRNPLRC